MVLESDERLITVIFLPPNCTSEGQPMDQGVINSIKKRYKKKLLLNVVLTNENLSMDDRLKKITLAECIEWVAEAWDEVSASTIYNSWRKLKRSDGQVAEPADDSLNESITLGTLAKSIGKLGGLEYTEDEVRCWENDCVRDVSGNWVTGDGEIYTDYEIVAYVKGTENKENECNDDENIQEEWLEEPDTTTDFQRAISSMDFLIKYMDRENMLPDVGMLRLMKNNIMERECNQHY
ncbi:jerky protein homolog-like [Sabethes cyaneus]|uniref:jerky protein homolog-like n=1 Tax=Sabethes cyaneus TaxID=53552 RepID=UPI00237DA91F|nr:jerky protein homolog-like [Sabethes cyaneus]